MSDRLESGDRGSEKTLTSELCEITGIDHNWARDLLFCANDDLNVALDMFYSDPGYNEVYSDTGRNNEVPVVVIDSDDEKDINSNDNLNKETVSKDNLDPNDENISNDNGKDTRVAGTNDEENNLINPSGSKDEDDGLNEDYDEYDEEKMLEKALKASEMEFQSNEPDPWETFQVLSKNYPQYDSTALRNLCVEYEGRSHELEIFVQHHIYTLPTKQEAKMEAEKMKLKAQLEDLVAAGVEEAKFMMVETCPGCCKPKIIQDESVKVFVCEDLDCKGEFCRMCKKAQHIPDPCEGEERKVKIWDDYQEFQIINMMPKRSFDEEDEIDKEFRLAEGQFLRLNGNCKIQSIDLVHNKRLEARFEAKKEEMKMQGTLEECLLLFHGTPQQNILPILQNNFDISIVANGRALGNGVYFSECPEVSMGYSIDQQSLILCKVLKGSNCVESRQPVRATVIVNGVQVFGGGMEERCWAVVVPDVDQILPKYVINFS